MVSDYNFNLDAKNMQMHVISSIEVHADTDYFKEMHDFMSIKSAHSLLIVNEFERTNASIGYKILYAMLHNKPIIAFNPPQPDDTLSPWLSRTIQNRLSKIFICNVSLLDQQDGSDFLKSIGTTDSVNYLLTKGEQILIRSALRAYFKNF